MQFEFNSRRTDVQVLKYIFLKTISECLFVLFNYQSRAGMFNESGYYFRENSKLDFFLFCDYEVITERYFLSGYQCPSFLHPGHFASLSHQQRRRQNIDVSTYSTHTRMREHVNNGYFPPPTLSVCSKLGVFRGVGSAWLGFSSTWTAILQEWWAFFVF